MSNMCEADIGIDDPQKSYFLSFLGNQKITNKDKPSKRIY